MLHSMKPTIVLYHKNCTDGFGAAWAAWKKLGDTANYLPVIHQEPPPEAAKGTDVYLVDFCYDEEVMKALIAKNRRVTALDHHAMREPAVRLTEGGVFDNGRSGSTIAWDYFHPGTPVPAILAYAEAGDLWQWDLPHAKEISAYLDIAPPDFAAWDALEKEIADDLQGCAEKGRLLLMNEDRLMERIVRDNAEEVIFEGYKVLAVNSPCFRSIIGHKLACDMPPFGIVWDRKRGKIVVSLRSATDFDVAELAARHGGGGHKAAAGFTIKDGMPLPWKTA